MEKDAFLSHYMELHPDFDVSKREQLWAEAYPMADGQDNRSFLARDPFANTVDQICRQYGCDMEGKRDTGCMAQPPANYLFGVRTMPNLTNQDKERLERDYKGPRVRPGVAGQDEDPIIPLKPVHFQQNVVASLPEGAYFSLIVLDEAHHAKDPTTKTSAMISNLMKLAPYAAKTAFIPATATPVWNSPRDVRGLGSLF